MIRHLRLIAQDPTLRVTALAVLAFGCLVASIGPFMSVLAVHEFGLTDERYSLLMVLASGMSVFGALGIGILADQRGAIRAVMILTTSMTVLGNALVLIWPSPTTFVVGHGIILPVAGALFGQLFALARIGAAQYEPGDRDAILSAVRALFAVPFVLILPLWSLVLDAGLPLLSLYLVTTACAGIMLALFVFYWPTQTPPRTLSSRSDQTPLQALRDVINGPIMLRVLAAGAINVGVIMYMIVLGLSFVATPGRDMGDVAIFAGLVAGFEIPVMLSMGVLLRHLSRVQAILLGAAIHGSFMLIFPVLAPTIWVWLLPLPAALGAGIILSLPLAYLQDLMGSKAGAGGSLIVLQKVASDGLCALLFALATWISGYGLAAALAGLSTICGASALLLLDRRLDLKKT